MHVCKSVIIAAVAWSCGAWAAERVNHEGRILGPEPVVSAAVLFNTPEADAIISAMQIMPRDSVWNEDISRRPLLSNSDAMIAQIIADLRSDRRMLRAFHEMNFALVPDNQPLVPIDFFNYADESDPGPYPIPSIMPVETWPRETGGLTLNEWQRDINDVGGDRHSIIVMPGAGFIWETWLTRLTSSGWEASNGAKFDLKSNAQRPFGWTSADAAGLPMFPALVRYDECQRGMVEHAMRIVVRRTRLGPIYPASHNASVGNLTDPNIPAMGQRVRLKASFVIPENWTIYEKAVLRGLKKYGAMVADNGNFFSISVTPDNRYPANAFSRLSSIAITNFEVVQTTGANEGPRSPNPPTANAGLDKTATVNIPVQLEGAVMYAQTIQWSVYSGPGQVSFGDAASANTTATFSAPGNYVVMLKAADDVHTPAFDAVQVTVTEVDDDFGVVRVMRTGSEIELAWDGPATNYTVQSSADLEEWSTLASIAQTRFRVPAAISHQFFRVRRDWSGRFAQEAERAAAALFDLVHGALAGRFIRTPAHEPGAVAEAATGEMVVGDFDDELRIERFPLSGAFGGPATRSAGSAAGEAGRFAQSFEFFG